MSASDSNSYKDIMVKIVNNGSQLIDGLESYSYRDICILVLDFLLNIIDQNEMDCEISAIALYGSRCCHASRLNSDLDVVVEFSGKEREDHCFNLFNEEALFIEGIKIDINPITRFKTGDINRFLEKSREYDALRT